MGGIGGPLIDVHDIVQVPDALGIRFGDAPRLLQPRLARVCVTVRRTVSDETVSTTASRTGASATNREVHRA